MEQYVAKSRPVILMTADIDEFLAMNLSVSLFAAFSTNIWSFYTRGFVFSFHSASGAVTYALLTDLEAICGQIPQSSCCTC